MSPPTPNILPESRNLPQRHLSLLIEPAPGRRQYRLRLFSLAALALACHALTACSIVTQLKPDVDQEPTGSIAPARASLSAPLRPPVAALPASLDPEDQRRALGALAIALDPQGNGATVHWDNPVSKAKGSLTPVGYAYPKNGLICRSFTAQIESPGLNQSAHGVACRDKAADWSLAEYQPAQKA